MATRVRQRISAVLDWADLHDFREGNPVTGKALETALARRAPPVKHHPAVPYDQVGNAIRKVRQSRANPATMLSLEFLILTVARSSEVRFATWDEIDVESRLWTVPAKRMKARRPHRVPLSFGAMDVLTQARSLNDEDVLISPSPLTGKTHEGATSTAKDFGKRESCR